MSPAVHRNHRQPGGSTARVSARDHPISHVRESRNGAPRITYTVALLRSLLARVASPDRRTSGDRSRLLRRRDLVDLPMPRHSSIVSFGDRLSNTHRSRRDLARHQHNSDLKLSTITGSTSALLADRENPTFTRPATAYSTVRTSVPGTPHARASYCADCGQATTGAFR